MSDSDAEAVMPVRYSSHSRMPHTNIPQLNPYPYPSPTVSDQDQQPSRTAYRLHVDWLHLILGVSTVVRDQWPALKASRMRPMVLYLHEDQYWEDLPFDLSSFNLSHCSSRFLIFARQAVADLKDSCDAIIRPGHTDKEDLRSTPGFSLATSKGAVTAVASELCPRIHVFINRECIPKFVGGQGSLSK
ncbi:uncharacterized protein BDV17DRAFT_293357 [Aspergillus undulatus]|uniref:uncharacterized protein n=1 Tax=Aspergillus undulatus TaxID=1810928 RepID=UPI003CCD3FD1